MLPHDIFQPLGRYFLCIQMKFGRQDDFFTKCLYSLPYDSLIVPSVFRQQIRPIGFGRIKKSTAKGEAS